MLTPTEGPCAELAFVLPLGLRSSSYCGFPRGWCGCSGRRRSDGYIGSRHLGQMVESLSGLRLKRASNRARWLINLQRGAQNQVARMGGTRCVAGAGPCLVAVGVQMRALRAIVEYRPTWGENMQFCSVGARISGMASCLSVSLSLLARSLARTRAPVGFKVCLLD